MDRSSRPRSSSAGPRGAWTWDDLLGKWRVLVQVEAAELAALERIRPAADGADAALRIEPLPVAAHVTGESRRRPHDQRVIGDVVGHDRARGDEGVSSDG